MLKISYTIIVKQEYHDNHDYCFHSIFTENYIQMCQTVLKCEQKWEKLTIVTILGSLQLLLAVKIARY